MSHGGNCKKFEKMNIWNRFVNRIVYGGCLIILFAALIQGNSLYNSLGYRDKEWTAQKNSKVRVICLGDSITESSVSSVEQTYPEFLQTNLGEEYEVLNAGRGGDDSIRCLFRLENHLLSYSPDILVAMFGINDVSQDHNGLKDYPFTLYQNLQKLKTICAENKIKLIFVLENYFPENGKYPECFSNEDEYALKYRHYAESAKEIFPNFVNPALMSEDALDRVHPNENGNKKIAEAVSTLVFSL